MLFRRAVPLKFGKHLLCLMIHIPQLLFSLSLSARALWFLLSPQAQLPPTAYASVFASVHQRPAAPLTALQESRIKLLYFYLCEVLVCLNICLLSERLVCFDPAIISVAGTTRRKKNPKQNTDLCVSGEIQIKEEDQGRGESASHLPVKARKLLSCLPEAWWSRRHAWALMELKQK